MGDLITLLSNASQSLLAARGAANTAANNIQNVNTPGYSRQRAVIQAAMPEEIVGGIVMGRGSRIAAVTQARDRFLESQVPATFGQEAHSKTLTTTLESVTQFDPARPGGVGNSISGFFDSLRILSQNSGDRALRDGAVNSAKALQASFQRASADIYTSRAALDQQVVGTVTEANALAVQVAELNKKIQMARQTANAEPNTLLDQRQKAQDRMAELVGARPSFDNRGNLTLTLPSGGALVAGELAATLVTKPNGSDHGHLQVLLRDSGGHAMALPKSAISGELGGQLEARDVTMKSAAEKLDLLAYEFAQAVNAAHATGVDLSGNAGGDLFDVGATADGAASRIKVTDAIAADSTQLATRDAAAGVGDNTTVRAMLALETVSLASGFPAGEAYANLVSDFGAATKAARAAADHDGALRTHLESMREAASGVSIDEELIEMQKAQRAYEAISKVIQTGDQMLDTLLKLR